MRCKNPDTKTVPGLFADILEINETIRSICVI